MCTGSLIPGQCVAALSSQLSLDSARTYTEQHQHSLSHALNGLRNHSLNRSLPTPSPIPSYTPKHIMSHKSLTSGASSPVIAPKQEMESALESLPLSAETVNDVVSESNTSNTVSEPVLSMPTFDFL